MVENNPKSKHRVAILPQMGEWVHSVLGQEV